MARRTIGSIGARAADILRSANRLQVAATYDRCFYLRTGPHFACIGDASIGDGPLNAVINDYRQLAERGPGETVWTAGETLNFSDGMVLEWTHAKRWSTPDWPRMAYGSVLPAATLQMLLAASRADGLFRLAAQQLQNIEAATITPLHIRADSALTALAKGLHQTAETLTQDVFLPLRGRATAHEGISGFGRATARPNPQISVLAAQAAIHDNRPRTRCKRRASTCGEFGFFLQHHRVEARRGWPPPRPGRNPGILGLAKARPRIPARPYVGLRCDCLDVEGERNTRDCALVAQHGVFLVAEPLRRDAHLKAAVTGLIGLGPGLTPSGDDVLAGALLGLHATGKALAAAQLGAHVTAASVDGTSPLSAAFLRCAIAGETSADLHQIFSSALTNTNWPAALDTLGRIGHTSGWDHLAGFLIALTAIQPRPRT